MTGYVERSLSHLGFFKYTTVDLGVVRSITRLPQYTDDTWKEAKMTFFLSIDPTLMKVPVRNAGGNWEVPMPLALYERDEPRHLAA